jgi:hypothetical protein
MSELNAALMLFSKNGLPNLSIYQIDLGIFRKYKTRCYKFISVIVNEAGLTPIHGCNP